MPDTAGNGQKWSRLWWSSSSQRGSNTAASEAPSTTDMLSTSIAVVVVHAQPRDFRIIRQEWTVVRIQFAFLAFLTLVCGRRVHKKLAVTQKCMNALLRVQERGRDCCYRISVDVCHLQDILDDRSGHEGSRA
ncbi:hypothetical protein ZEAMMB73_Zm00001d015502 [Zea mays]|uniref:Uncharacterized protein n=1 Tax=Zea mays TaxID=4577 RepID=A0A1D6H2I6_MAIZE|nr:hypothetical protein ZEAMMB73_Zm00001d015502 [Zea mays]